MGQTESSRDFFFRCADCPRRGLKRVRSEWSWSDCERARAMRSNIYRERKRGWCTYLSICWSACVVEGPEATVSGRVRCAVIYIKRDRERLMYVSIYMLERVRSEGPWSDCERARAMRSNIYIERKRGWCTYLSICWSACVVEGREATVSGRVRCAVIYIEREREVDVRIYLYAGARAQWRAVKRLWAGTCKRCAVLYI